MNLSQNYKKIAVIGGINMDIAGFPDKSLVQGDSNPGKTSLSPGGVGRNIAENIALMGDCVEMYSVVGNDLYGKSLLEQTSKSGVDMSHVKIIPDMSTGTYMVILDGDMDMFIAISSMDIFLYLNKNYLLENKDQILKSNIIVFDTNLSKENLEFAVELFKNKKLFLDTVSSEKAKNAKNIIGKFHTIKPNKLEAQILTDMMIITENDLLSAAEILHSKGVVNVCISLGSDGVFFSNHQEKGIVKIPDVKIKNATGAGDSFQAGLVHGELLGLSLSESVKIASATAAITMDSKNTINENLTEEKIINLSKKMEVRKIWENI